MRGRVSAVNSVFISSSNELGEFESGMTAKWFGELNGDLSLGPILSVVFGGFMTIFVVAMVAKRWPVLLRLGPLHEIKPPLPEVESEQGASGLTGS
jgi:hypothetical protein